MAAPHKSSQMSTDTHAVKVEEAPTINGNSAKLTNGEKRNPAATLKSQPKAKTTGALEGAEASEKLTGAELKKKAKAEKAARRAQEKQAKPQAILPDLKTPKKVETLEEVGRRGSAGAPPGTPIIKSSHKPTGSTQKSMPLRPAPPPTTTGTVQAKKDNKNVALFGHLYGQPRRTTIAAAGKDVHPAILALGLQMSNYVICGSNARCVATLLAFKRVWSSSVFGLYTC